MSIRSIFSTISTVATTVSTRRADQSKKTNQTEPGANSSVSQSLYSPVERVVLGKIEAITTQTKSIIAKIDPAIFRIGCVGPLVTLATLPGEAYSAKLIPYLGGKGDAPKFDRSLFRGAHFVVALRIATRSTVFNVQERSAKYLNENILNTLNSDKNKSFWVGLFSGVSAGLSETLFHPLGQINTRIQTAPNLSIIDAAKRLYQSGNMLKGISITASRDVSSATVTFTTLQMLKSCHTDAELQDPKTMAKIGAISGGVSGAITAIPAIILNNLANNPFGKIQLPGPKTILATAAARSATLGTVVGAMSFFRALQAQWQTEFAPQ